MGQAIAACHFNQPIGGPGKLVSDRYLIVLAVDFDV